MGDDTWCVVGGGNKGGIIAREGKALASPECLDRLATGSLVRQLEMSGERLRFELVAGSGPATGWVSTKVQGKQIITKGGYLAAEEVDFGRPIPSSLAARQTCIWLVANSSRNCANAFVALAVGLKKAGYHVRLFCPKANEILVRSFGLSFTAAGISLEDWQSLKLLRGQIDRMFDMFQYGLDTNHDMTAVVWNALADASAPPDLVVHHFDCMNLASALFVKYGIATQQIQLGFPWDAFDYGKYEFHQAVDSAIEEITGVAPVRSMSWETFYGIVLNSRQIIGVSKGEMELAQDVEHARNVLTKVGNNFVGYLHIPAPAQIRVQDETVFGGTRVLEMLESFMSAGSPPVYMGWGRRVIKEHGGALLMSIVEALKRAGLRGIVLSGQADLSHAMLAATVPCRDELGLCKYAEKNIVFVPVVSQDWLFPKCNCLVHHGSPGTTAASLRAMVPIIVTPMEPQHWQYGAWIEKMGVGLQLHSGLWEASVDQLAGVLAEVQKPTYRNKAKEVGAAMRGEAGVVGAVTGINIFVTGFVKTGKVKEEWESVKQIEATEKAFQKELEDASADGVLHPPQATSGPCLPTFQDVLPARNSKNLRSPPSGGKGTRKVWESPPVWLVPDGKAKILLTSTPLKGHIIHFKRVAQWFSEKAPDYEIHMVLYVDEPGFPACVVKHIMRHDVDASEAVDGINDMFAIAAGLELGNEHGHRDRKPPSEAGKAWDFNATQKFMLDTFLAVRPDILITEWALRHGPLEGFLAGLCRHYNALLVVIVPMCIKEDMDRSMRQVQRSLDRKKELEGKAIEAAQAIGIFARWTDEVGAENAATPQPEEECSPPHTENDTATGHPASTSASPAVAQEDGAPAWLPAGMSVTTLNHILWKVMPEIQWHPYLQLLPSPAFFHSTKLALGEMYCAPFLPLPRLTSEGAPQHCRAALEGNVPQDLLQWLYTPENSDPIVYVALGTIVSTFNSRKLVERLVEALSGAYWRVLLVLPGDARDGLPKPGDNNPWRWTAGGVATVKQRSREFGDPQDGDAFTDEHMSLFGKISPELRDYHQLAEREIILKRCIRTEALTPERWRVESFVPQIQVLRCERVRCFVSHNGANSTLESMACGVPMLCTPFFLDQYDWAYTVRHNLRAGIQIDKILTEAPAIRAAVTELLEDPSYSKNARAVAQGIAAQADTLATRLGKAMMPEASLGPGLSILGALCVAHIKQKDMGPIFEMVK